MCGNRLRSGAKARYPGFGWLQPIPCAHSTRDMRPTAHRPKFSKDRIAFVNDVDFGVFRDTLSRGGEECVEVKNKCMYFSALFSCRDERERCCEI